MRLETHEILMLAIYATPLLLAVLIIIGCGCYRELSRMRYLMEFSINRTIDEQNHQG